MRATLLCVTLTACALCVGQAQKAAVAMGPKAEVKGTIERIQLSQGQGTPYLELATAKGTQRVMLGSMRYLMEKNFNPKAGSTAVVKGFVMNDVVVAQTVTLPTEKVTLELRDDNGMPLWRQGRYGQKKE